MRDQASAGKAPLSAEAEFENILEPLEKTGPWGRRVVAGLAAFVALGASAYIVQITQGLKVTGMRDFFSWGIYITNFVFFIGVSHAGTLISAILRVTGAEWRRPITRMAEAITVFALMVGAPMVIIDLGRPDRLLNVFLHGRIQSPILWDVCSIATYLTGSLLYLYLPMIPDLAYLRDHPQYSSSPWRRKLYSTLALGWNGAEEQKRRLEKAIAVMAIIIIPVAVSVHTVVSWIFGMTLRPGWHSTIFGPYFVVGAIFSGIAAIITAMAIFRKAYHLEAHITLTHFRNLGSLLLTLNLIYIYFTISEYLTIGYVGESIDVRLVHMLFTGTYRWEFWVMGVVGLFLPAFILSLPWTRTIAGIVTASVMVNIGMWLKRYVVVIPTLATPYLPKQGVPPEWMTYSPTWVEWSITLGAFAAFTLLYIFFSKLFPIVSIWEVQEGEELKDPKIREASHAS